MSDDNLTLEYVAEERDAFLKERTQLYALVRALTEALGPIMSDKLLLNRHGVYGLFFSEAQFRPLNEAYLAAQRAKPPTWWGRALSVQLFGRIKHGDEKHQAWLATELDKFFQILELGYDPDEQRGITEVKP